MKALSIRQPWAWLIVQGRKDIENRSWATRYRGPLIIHASKGMTREEFDHTFIFAVNACGFRGHFPRFEELERGGIVGALRMVDCVRPSAASSPWHMEGQHGFLLADARPLPFVPMNGRLGFFDVPADVVAQVAAQMEAA